MNTTPISDRLVIAPAMSGGRFSPNGLRAFEQRFATLESLSDFMSWREHPVTRAYLAALRALAVSMPLAHVSRDSIEAQYGMQCGLTLASSLADDPTSVLPSLFSRPSSGPEVEHPGILETEYSARPDDT